MGCVAIYAGSFDPITNGHIDVLRGGLRVAERIVVAIGIHPGKQPLFTFEERMELIRAATREAFSERAGDIDVITFDDLLVDRARQIGATLVIRGVRDGTDLDYEMRLAGMNSALAPDIQTVFLPAGGSARAVTGTLVRQVAGMGGDVSRFVPDAVVRAFQEKFNR